jgi:hypothetical protein
MSLTPRTALVGAGEIVHLEARLNGTLANVNWSQSNGVLTPTGTGTADWQAPAIGVSTVTATAGPNSDTSTFTVGSGFATVTGTVLNQTTVQGIGNVVVDFLQGAILVASTTTSGNGTFSVGVPPTANRFHIRSTSGLSLFYKQYTYNGKRYTMLDSSCSAPLPALTVGQVTPLTTSVLVPPSSGPPPPPPNGCQ